MYAKKPTVSIWCDEYRDEVDEKENTFFIKPTRKLETSPWNELSSPPRNEFTDRESRNLCAQSVKNMATNPWDEQSSPPRYFDISTKQIKKEAENYRIESFPSSFDHDDVIPPPYMGRIACNAVIPKYTTASTSKNHSELDQIKKKFSLDSIDEYQKPSERVFHTFEQLRRDLECTLNSKEGGYSKIAHLSRDFAEDTGVDPEKAAYKFGYASFEALLKSNALKSTVCVNVDDAGQVRYLPHKNPRYDHIREAQTISRANFQCINDKKERERLGRACLPEYREKLLEGKVRLVAVAEELGAEKRYVEFRVIQDAYLQKYGTVLNKEETKRLFDHSSISKVFSTICTDEFEMNEEESYSGYVYVKLRRPADEIHVIHAKCREELANPVPSTKKPKQKKIKVPLSERELTFQPILPSLTES